MIKKALRLLIKLFLYVLLEVVYLISGAVPKNKNIWIFGSWFGKKFADNSKYLFLYVKRNHPEIRSIWLTHNPRVFLNLRRKGYEVYKIHSMKGLLYSMRASCVIVSTGLSDVNRYAIMRVKKIQLWHGTPLKKLERAKGSYDNRNYKEGNKFLFLYDIVHKVFPFTNEHYDIVIATSEEARENMSLVFNMDKEKIVVTGYPRNDALLDASWLTSNKCDYLENIRSKVDFRCIVVYLPTHRGEGKKKEDLFEKYDFKIDILQQMLEKLNAIFIIKAHHYHNRLNLPYDKKKLQRIYTPSDDELPDVYPLLKETDILITDYSSVYFDYLLLDKPIIFAPFDINKFLKEERELFYDYTEVTPGPKAKNWQEVFRLVEEVLQNDYWKEERKIICGRFNKFKDNRNSERVFKVIRDLK